MFALANLVIATAIGFVIMCCFKRFDMAGVFLAVGMIFAVLLSFGVFGWLPEIRW